MVKDAIRININDNVVTAIRDLYPQQMAIVGGDGKEVDVEIKTPIAFGHKFAVRKIIKGEDIIKYGVTTRSHQGRFDQKRPFGWQQADCILYLPWFADNWRYGNRPRHTFLS